MSRSQTNPPIVPGQSTADDVTRLLGAPNEVVQLGRKSAWRYEHTVEKQAGLFLILLGLRGVDSQADPSWTLTSVQTGHLVDLLPRRHRPRDVEDDLLDDSPSEEAAE